MSHFGARLKEFRDAHGWSQERVGFELGVTKATISKWENGRAEPGLDNLVKIRRLYELDGLTLDHLIDDAAAGKAAAKTAQRISEGGPDNPRLARSQAEIALLTRFRALSSSQRQGLLDLLKQ